MLGALRPVLYVLRKCRGTASGSPGRQRLANQLESQSAHYAFWGISAQRVIRPAVEAIGLPWYGWHGFRRGIASNLYELGANEKIVQRILRHANPHVTKDRYIKAFDPAVLDAMQRMQATVDVLEKSPAVVQQMN